MNTYDPGETPDAVEWLETDEGARIEMVRSFHQRAGTRLPNPRLHATFHVIVESQLAMAEGTVVATLARLQQEGSSRHDAVHAVGSVLAEHIYELFKNRPGFRAPIESRSSLRRPVPGFALPCCRRRPTTRSPDFTSPYGTVSGCATAVQRTRRRAGF